MIETLDKALLFRALVVMKVMLVFLMVVAVVVECRHISEYLSTLICSSNALISLKESGPTDLSKHPKTQYLCKSKQDVKCISFLWCVCLLKKHLKYL